MTLVRYNESMPSLASWVDDFFSSTLLPAFGVGRMWNTPAVNVREDHDNFYLEVAAPGLNKKDFDITLDNGLITISAKHEEQKQENNNQYTRREFSYTGFSRTFTLPDGVDQDKISAQYQNGILYVTLPKTEEVKGKAPRTIKIS
ncbi:MAG: heat-shock protein [Chitinophagales bacterium]|nr:MAG: heat-shock protein [Chitinophagales bacterium]